MSEINIQSYMSNAIRRIMAKAYRNVLSNPREAKTVFGVKQTFIKSESRRKTVAKESGVDVPPFLICSISTECNLSCKGCYARANGIADNPGKSTRPTLTPVQWREVFAEASSLGINFALLAGGEPMMRRGVIEAASKKQNILFPIFTNGTFMDDRYFELFDRSRNLIPIMSIEGEKETTDTRRGEGVYDKLISNMDTLKEKGLIYGASVTVTTQNINEVTSDVFLNKLKDRGCKAVIFVEFVPMTDESKDLAPGEKEREYLKNAIERLREDMPQMVFVSFPGDEKSSGGCVAAGRGFFHINSHGGAEPCPFSPYSDTNVRSNSLREVINSPLFRVLREGDLLVDDHEGGCVLYEKREQVEALLHKEYA